MIDFSLFDFTSMLGGLIAQSVGPLTGPTDVALPAGQTGVPTALAVLFGVAGLLLGGFGMSLYSVSRVKRWRNEKDDAVRYTQEATLARAEAMGDKDRFAAELGQRNQEVDIYTRQVSSLQTQLAQAREGWKNSDVQIEELGAALKDMRVQTEQLRHNFSEAERMSSERAQRVISLNSQLEDTQARLSETMRVAAERQAGLAQSNGLVARQRARLAEIGFISSEVQSALTSMNMHLDSLRQRVLIDGPDTAALPGMEIPSLPEQALSESPLSEPPARSMPPPPVHREPEPEADFDEAPESEVKAPASALGDFGSKVVSLAANLNRLSSLISQRAKPDVAEPAPAPRAPVPAPPPAPVADPLPRSTRIDETPTVLAAFEPPANISSGHMTRLQAIKGVGVVYAVRLSQSGVASVADLANATVEQLDAVIKAPRWRKPNYADWVSQAKHAMATDGKLEVAAAPGAV